MNKELRQKGWTEMSQQLDTHLPKRRRRLLGLWWLWGLGFLLLSGLIWWVVTDQTPTETPSVASTTLADKSEVQQPVYSLNETQKKSSEALTVGEGDAPAKADPIRTSRAMKNKAGSFFYTANTPISKENSESAGRNLLNAEVGRESITHIAGELISPASVVPSDPVLNRMVERLPALDNSLLPSALPSLQGVSLPSVEEIEPTSIPSNSFFLDLSSGLRTVEPHSYIAQVGMGWQHHISEKLSYDFILGGGIEGLHQEVTTELKERERFASRQDSEFGQGPINNVNADGSYGQASLQARQNYFAYLGVSANYTFAPRWSMRFGLDLVCRLHTSYKGFYRIEGQVTDISGGEYPITSRIIEDEFHIFNRWDLRPHLGIRYDLQSDMQLYLSYRHGISPVLANPSTNSPAGSARFLTLGCQYTF